jgi:mannitol/fructose-specific phosphotransferase system IIA component
MLLREGNILLNQHFNSKDEAIKKVGELLVSGNYVKEAYIGKMLERENISTTYIGNNIAIPHGTSDSQNEILESGISIVQIPEGVSFGNDVAKVVIGIAGKGNTHLGLLSNIAVICSDIKNVDKIVNAKTKQEILELFGAMDL